MTDAVLSIMRHVMLPNSVSGKSRPSRLLLACQRDWLQTQAVALQLFQQHIQNDWLLSSSNLFWHNQWLGLLGCQ